MKYLCICNHGNVRSAAMARYIKDLKGSVQGQDVYDIIAGKQKEWNEAIAVGAHSHNRDSMECFIAWADKVFCFCEGQESQDYIKDLSKEKYVNCNIGVDRWGNPFDGELRELVKNLFEEQRRMKA